MKNLRVIFLTLILFACNSYDQVSPNVQSYTLSSNNSTNQYEWERVAPTILIQFYAQSSKDKGFYEVVENKFSHVLNYCPEKQLLSIAREISSGWQNQYVNVSEDKLRELAKAYVRFDQYDSILTRANPADFKIVESNYNTKLTN
jgi:L-rhamnose isomerase